MRLVKISPKYYESVRALRNDLAVQPGFVCTTYIGQKAQTKYMKKHKDCYYVCLYERKFVGYIGVIKDDIRICVVPGLQNKGIGRFMINEIMEVFPNATAKIKVGNKASLRLFEKAGFSIKYFLLEK